MNLILENGNEEEIFYLKRWVNKNYGECDVICEAYRQKDAVLTKLKECKKIFFTSTFINSGEITTIAKLLLLDGVKPLEIFAHGAGTNIKREFGYIFTNQEIENLIESGHTFYGIDDEYQTYKFDLQTLLPDYVKKDDRKYVDLGFKVIINDIKAQGKLFETLKTGDIKKAYKLEGDPKSVWGVYVDNNNGDMVKVIVSDKYKEFDLYYDIESKYKATDLLHYFASHSHLSDEEKFKKLSIRECIKFINIVQLDTIDNLVDLFLSTFVLEKRYHYALFSNLLRKYRTQRTYFLEYNKSFC